MKSTFGVMPRCIHLEGVSSMGMITDIATCRFNIRKSEMRVMNIIMHSGKYPMVSAQQYHVQHLRRS